jgi:hypothetical protein
MKTLEDFKSKFCDDCTGACQGMCYGFISAEDQFLNYKKKEYLRYKTITIWATGDNTVAGLLTYTWTDKVILRIDRDSFDEVYRELNNFILGAIDSE